MRRATRTGKKAVAATPRSWALVVLLAGLFGGCLAPSASRCGDGRICPVNTRCDVKNSRCVGPLEEEACSGRGPGDACALIGAPGFCNLGVCTPLFCGDGMRSGTEACDGPDLDTKTCAGLGYYRQTTGLACKPDCTFDTTGCAEKCGDQMINGSEQCDGDNLGGADCRKQGFYAGAGLKCSASCTFDVSACTGTCGDGVVDGTEACDGKPPAGKSCVDYGFDRGLLACSSQCGPALEGCRSFGWTAILSPPSGPLRDMWATGPDDVFALGSSGTSLLHWDGASWSSMSTGVAEPATLTAIWGSSPDDLYVVGQSQRAAVISHWNGMEWTRVGPNLAVRADEFSGPSYLADVWGTGPNDVFAVGGYLGSVVVHWNGGHWSTHVFPTPPALPNLAHVWGSGPQDVFAVGGTGTVHWDGAAWSRVPLETSWPLMDIAGSGADDVIGVGPTNDGNMSSSVIRHFDGATWSPVSLGTIVSPAGLWAGELHDVFLLGVKNSAGDKSSVTLRWNGRSWDKVRVKAPTGKLTFGATFPGGVFASGEDGTVARWDYTSWSADGVMANGVWSNGPNDAVAAGAGALFHWDGTGWFAMATATSVVPNMAAVWGTSPDDSWAVGAEGAILHWDGARWSPKTPGIPPAFLRAVWGSTSTDVYAVGDTGTILHWNGHGWTSMASGSAQDFSGVWSSGADDVYVVGPDKGGKNAVLHFDGTGWSPVFSGPTPLRSVWGSGPHDVYVGGDAGTILHWDGAAWTKMVSRSTQTIFGISGRGPTDVFAAADKTLLHLRDQAWEQVALPSSNQLRGLSVTPSRVFVVGVLPENHLDRNVSCVGPERACKDGWDNDCDGLADAADPDCGGKAAEVCANLADDDHDGLVDCADLDCADFGSCKKR